MNKIPLYARYTSGDPATHARPTHAILIAITEVDITNILIEQDQEG